MSSMTMEWTPPAAKPTGPRADRKSQLVPLEIGSDRFGRTRVVVRNLSPYGLGVRGDVELIACERVIVYLPDGRQVGATVRWVRKNTFGLALDEAINPATLQPRPASKPADLMTRDEQRGFVALQVNANVHRPGFIRSHRDEILDGASHWVRD